MDSNNNNFFDHTSLDDQEDFDKLGRGVGEVYGTTRRVGYDCGKLVGEDVSDYPTYSLSVEDDKVRQILQEDGAGGGKYVTSSNDDTSGCLPDDNDYVFEVKPSDVAGGRGIS